jgi:hypothetical protein
MPLWRPGKIILLGVWKVPVKAPVSFGSHARRLLLLAFSATLLLSAQTIHAQYPGQVKKPDSKEAPEMRAVAVLEYTGEAGHPKASRLIPISLYDGQQLQDAGIYLARPYPLALQGGVEYQIQLDGRAVGYFDVKGVSRQQDSWLGEGIWKPLVSARSASQLARANVKIKIDEDEDVSNGPVLHRKSHEDEGTGNNGPSGPPPDPDRPTLKRSPDAESGAEAGTDSGSGSGSGTGSGSHPNASSGSGGPVLHRSPSADDSAGGNNAPDDPDRPHLQKKPQQNSDQASNKPASDEGSVESLPEVSDPNRPRLIRGKPTDDGLAVAPTVMGLPPELEQQVAVSDSKTTPDHPWNFTWANPDDEAKMKSDLEAAARTALGLDHPSAPPPAAAPKKTTARPGTRSSTAKPTPPPAPAPLLDEQFRVFELAYGSGATIVLSAHTDGAGAQQKFVTLIAQPNLYGSAVVLLKNVTDAAHLDDNPRMRLIDAV